MRQKNLAVSRRLIQLDLEFALALASLPMGRGKESLQFAHLARLSLIAYEVTRFIERHMPEVAIDDWRYKRELASSRHSVKLLNDSKKDVELLLGELNAAAVRIRRWFVVNNRIGSLLERCDSLAKLLIEDTGVVSYRGAPVATSHSIVFFAGLEPGAEKATTTERYAEIGNFLSGAGKLFDVAEAAAFMPGLNQAELIYKDTQFERLYPQMFPELDLPEAIAFGILWCEANSLQLLGAATPPDSALSPAVAKQRFAGTWQLIQSLLALKDHLSESAPSSSLLSQLADLTDDGSVRAFRSDEARRLRNSLVHYGIDPKVDVRETPTDPALGLLVAHGFEDTWAGLDSATAASLEAVKGVFSEVTGEFHQTLRDPHE